MTVLQEALENLAEELDWLDDRGSFPRKLSWLAARAREVGAADDPAAARALLEEPDFADAKTAAEADQGLKNGGTWAGRAIRFLVVAVRVAQEVDRRLPPPPPPKSTGAPAVVSELKAARLERAEATHALPSVIPDDDDDAG